MQARRNALVLLHIVVFVWGFTAKLLDVVLDLAGLMSPWDESVRRDLPPHYWRR